MPDEARLNSSDSAATIWSSGATSSRMARARIRDPLAQRDQLAPHGEVMDQLRVVARGRGGDGRPAAGAGEYSAPPRSFRPAMSAHEILERWSHRWPAPWRSRACAMAKNLAVDGVVKMVRLHQVIDPVRARPLDERIAPRKLFVRPRTLCGSGLCVALSSVRRPVGTGTCSFILFAPPPVVAPSSASAEGCVDGYSPAAPQRRQSPKAVSKP